jgi:hypothetical protein
MRAFRPNQHCNIPAATSSISVLTPGFVSAQINLNCISFKTFRNASPDTILALHALITKLELAAQMIKNVRAWKTHRFANSCCHVQVAQASLAAGQAPDGQPGGADISTRRGHARWERRRDQFCAPISAAAKRAVRDRLLLPSRIACPVDSHYETAFTIVIRGGSLLSYTLSVRPHSPDRAYR